ncbi:hypothetical protein GOP47_0002845 [Adiantum capillus-veneris]|uniref:NAD(+) kinase n=1 Tax=Adiantum capillus-veneris TaxID=13818 RepID=A0A9D4VBE0_ADICA|nr:hypothetical protein GOP47_0002845 [Adiantum capillus-veneris]
MCSITRACATHGKDTKQKVQKSYASSSRYLRFGGAYEDDTSDSDGDRMFGLAAAYSDTSAAATLSSEHFMEQEVPRSTNSKQVRKRGTSTRDWRAMEPFDSTSIEQMKDEDLWHFRHGPLPGDLAEVEAFCRIFRLAEQVHNAVMDALRSVNDARELVRSPTDANNHLYSANQDSLEDEDVPLLEEKVVSGLGCIGALLHQQKQEVLSGRLNAGFTPVARRDSMPPLALFRAEIKRCCEELESLLLCYFPADDVQFKPLHKKFQKLRNICLDAGYTRSESAPSHADIPNWGVVKSKAPWNDETSELDGEIAFWRGGQLTDDGVQWLIDKSFKVIVDMRAEDSADYLAKSAIATAVSSGKLKLIRLPVEAGSNPTKDQVIEFSKLVADRNSCPLYLHSQKGVGRTSAMVSRWREIGLLSSSLEEQTLPNSLKSHNLPPGADQKLVENASQHVDSASQEFDVSSSTGTPKLANKNMSKVLVEPNSSPGQETFVCCTPFEAQRPVANYLSKQEISKFLKRRLVSPGTFQWKGSAKAARVGSIHQDETDRSLSSTGELARRWRLNGAAIPRAEKLERKSGETNGSAQSVYVREDSVSIKQVENLAAVNEEPELKASFVTPQERPNEGVLLKHSDFDDSLDDDDDAPIVGDMCASTTGVVRLQSRRKAEMYLVRTDGFSCTREKVKESTLAFTHPSTQQQMLMWKTAPKTVLLLKKLGSELMEEAQQVASFLHYKEGMNVIVEPDVHDHFARVPGFGFIQTFHIQDTSNLHQRIDFVVCLGGDGVILYASNIFRNAVPPVVSFNLGSLGFLTAHPFDDFMQDLRAIIHGNTMVEGVYITLRMRLRCELFRNSKPVPGKVFDVLNEVVVDRGSNPYLCKIECYERNRLITKVQADGVIVATPTGSTAYSTAAGGSMVHPNVPCMLFTPICPHSLSFRPVILPDSALLELKVPEDARSNAWVSFDGKRRQQLSRGDSVRICMSQHPLPTVNKSDQTDDWFQSLVRCLNWNERLEQKALP